MLLHSTVLVFNWDGVTRVSCGLFVHLDARELLVQVDERGAQHYPGCQRHAPVQREQRRVSRDLPPRCQVLPRPGLIPKQLGSIQPVSTFN